MILETSFVIDFLRNESNAVSKMKDLKDKKIPYAITTPSVFELWGGLYSLEKSEKQKNNLDLFIEGQVILPLDKESAKEAGEIDGVLVKSGREIDVEDCMIAGIAITNNRKVLTRDEHFKRIEDLKVEEY